VQVQTRKPGDRKHFGWQQQTIGDHDHEVGIEAAQLILGLSAPPLLILHVLGTAIAHDLYGLEDRYEFVLWAIWIADPTIGLMQVAALIVTWIHGCIGLNFWLRVKPWFPRWRWALGAAALLIPVLALLGFADGGREVGRLAQDPAWLPQMLAAVNAPSGPEIAHLYRLRDWLVGGFTLLVAGVFVVRALRVLATRHRAIPRGRPRRRSAKSSTRPCPRAWTMSGPN